MSGPATVWTIGHSTHSADRFIELLWANGIRVLVDIRRFPTSRWPQFKQDNLRAHLGAVGVEYVHLAELGGYRGDYLAHTKSEEFRHGVEQLLTIARERRAAIMCAEAVFFRCHRRFVADVLVAEGHSVVHIFPDGRTQPHRLRTEGYAVASGTARRTRARTARR